MALIHFIFKLNILYVVSSLVKWTNAFSNDIFFFDGTKLIKTLNWEQKRDCKGMQLIPLIHMDCISALKYSSKNMKELKIAALNNFFYDKSGNTE